MGHQKWKWVLNVRGHDGQKQGGSEDLERVWKEVPSGCARGSGPTAPLSIFPRFLQIPIFVYDRVGAPTAAPAPPAAPRRRAYLDDRAPIGVIHGIREKCTSLPSELFSLVY
ncbi:hypothetical protein EVAR_64935_1 [Eumeta japonica]|uniref:Uncharacterized protein n=1 Tax=Eumeta variegata TaxID=151549 RepID=A0A4C1ZF84_EUMVA|nr:hypothetical protein EVAR_64935_1 [Eumeta japonica]